MSQQDTSDEDWFDRRDNERLNHERWVQALRDGTLLGLRCDECDYVTTTPKAACPRCGSRSIPVFQLPEIGTVYTKTTIEVAPPDHGDGYQIAIVELGDGRILGRIKEQNRVEIGDHVSLVGVYEYRDDVAPVFEPV